MGFSPSCISGFAQPWAEVVWEEMRAVLGLDVVSLPKVQVMEPLRSGTLGCACIRRIDATLVVLFSHACGMSKKVFVNKLDFSPELLSCMSSSTIVYIILPRCHLPQCSLQSSVDVRNCELYQPLFFMKCPAMSILLHSPQKTEVLRADISVWGCGVNGLCSVCSVF